jgi:hypothetical protein
LCHQQDANTLEVIPVPPNLSFDERVKYAQGILNRRMDQEQQEQRERARASECRDIDRELATIWKGYENWQFNAQSQISRDRERTRELRGRRSQLGCQTQ